jgi:hypothetical protein
MSDTNRDIWKQLNRVVSVIPKQYIDALLILHEKLEKNIKWVINGDLAESLRIVKVEPDCIEIVSSKEDVKKIFRAVQEFAPQPITFQTRQLKRNAVIEAKEYPVYVRSHYFEFNLNAVNVRVHGDLQYKVDDWAWGEVFDFTPEYVYVVGKKIAVTPLPIAYELYCNLGWIDRVEKIKEVTQKSRRPNTVTV